MRSTERFLLTAARAGLQDQAVPDCASIPDCTSIDVDAAPLPHLAEAHGLLPFIGAIAADELQDSAASECHAAWRRTVLRQLSMIGLLTDLQGDFRRGGIPAIPFKGPTLSFALYG